VIADDRAREVDHAAGDVRVQIESDHSWRIGSENRPGLLEDGALYIILAFGRLCAMHGEQEPVRFCAAEVFFELAYQPLKIGTYEPVGGDGPGCADRYDLRARPLEDVDESAHLRELSFVTDVSLTPEYRIEIFVVSNYGREGIAFLLDGSYGNSQRCLVSVIKIPRPLLLSNDASRLGERHRRAA
jgi:hypothetical protein